MKNILPAVAIAQICLASACAALLCSCSTAHLSSPTSARTPVRNLDFSKAPELKELAGHARELGDEMYPKICALLLDEAAKPPPQFDLLLKPLKSRNTGEAHVAWKRIYVNSDYLTNKTDLLEHFDKVFVHEMTHMAVQHRHWIVSLWSSDSPASGYWGESIANYAFYKLIGTNGWFCPECNTRFPHYTSGYTCGGAFLLYLEANYGTNLVRQLVGELRRRSYTDKFFATATEKSLDALWAEFQKTRAFKSVASEAYELQRSLGYKNGLPPRNVLARFDKFVDQNADDFTKMVIKSNKRDGNSIRDIKELTALYLYLTQPGGSPERFAFDLGKKGGLPGVAKGEKGWFSKFRSFDEMESRAFPVSLTIDFRKAADASQCHYTVSRASRASDWKLDKAWRTAPDGKVIEEYRVP